MEEKSIRAEMHQIVDDHLSRGESVDRDTLVHKTLETRSRIEGEDAPFYRVHTFADLQKVASKVIGKYEPKDKTEEELLLPGFTHLQRAYQIKRNETVMIVPVDQCSDDELKGRAALLDEMAKGCRDHAREIREYVLARGKSAA